MIRAVFFDIGGTVHVQHASPACDRNYAQRLWEFLNRHDIGGAAAGSMLHWEYPFSRCVRRA